MLPPISLILATWVGDYVAGLTATRYRGASSSGAAREGLNRWIGLFASAAGRSVTDAGDFEDRVARIQEGWRVRVGRVRADSATDRLIRSLPGAPIVTVAGAADLIGRSFQQTNEGIARLVEADILRPVTLRRRNRAFEAAKIIDAFTDLERATRQSGGRYTLITSDKNRPAASMKSTKRVTNDKLAEEQEALL